MCQFVKMDKKGRKKKLNKVRCTKTFNVREKEMSMGSSIKTNPQNGETWLR